MAQDSGWYPALLNPIVEAIRLNPNKKKILDIGTGPGKLPELLLQKESDFEFTGIDINGRMIDKAKERVNARNVFFQTQTPNAPLGFPNDQFDFVCFSSVLFLLSLEQKQLLMDEAVRVLKIGGKILVLTPTGSKSIWSSILEIGKFPANKYNWTYLVWKMLTSNTARRWQVEKWLWGYSQHNGLAYHTTQVFNDNSRLEIITKTK